MAELTVLSSHIYNVSDGVFRQTETGDGVLTESPTPDADNTFEAGDTFTITVASPFGPVPISASYAGFLADFDGETAAVLFCEDPNVVAVFGGPVYIVLSSRDTVNAPGSINFGSAMNSGAFTTCFLPGTAIATPTGETPVEALQIGDAILTADGRVVPVRWIGRQTVMTSFGPADRLMPVRVAAGALGAGLPRRDLMLTADHALMIDGMLVNAGVLVNGTTVTRVPLSGFNGRYTVYHVETEAHDLIVAEGAVAETYVDYVARRAFDNHAEYLALYGEDRPIAEHAMPRISALRQLPPGLRRRLGITRAA